MTKPKKKPYGTLTAGFGTDKQKEFEVTEYFQAQYKDDRVITLLKIEDGSFHCGVRNPENSGRQPKVQIWLTKDSLVGLISTALLYFKAKGEDFNKLVEESINDNEIEYSYSDNIENQLLKD